MAISKRYIIHTQETGWLELQDWRPDGSDDGQARIELKAKQSGPPAIGDEEIPLWLTTDEAVELSAALNVILGRERAEDQVILGEGD